MHGYQLQLASAMAMVKKVGRIRLEDIEAGIMGV